MEPGRNEEFHRGAQCSLSYLRQAQLHRHPSVQPDVQDLSGVTEDAKNTVYLRPETAQGIFVNFKMYRELPARRFPSVSDRSVSPSVTRSHPAISLSVPESLNRWSWSSSASPAPIWSGSSTGEASAVTGCCLLASRKTR